MPNSVIVRSEVKARSRYEAYREDLRRDFYRSCSYCTISEFEAQAIGFEIDHYEPRSTHPEKIREYSNLMYCCTGCNRTKGNKEPSEKQKEKSFRFVKVDKDVYIDHFRVSDNEIESRTNIGTFSIDYLNLNRETLRRLRNIRRRLYECLDFTNGGVFALLDFNIDNLPKQMRARVNALKASTEVNRRKLEGSVADILQRFAGSDLMISDTDIVEYRRRNETRRTVDPELRALRPDDWK